MKNKFTDPKQGTNPQPTKPKKGVACFKEQRKPVTATGKIRFNG